MVKPNRSVLRSKNMLRKAYIELSTEKDASKITVVDVVNRANLSRNTFYAHYPDVSAIAEEIKNEFIQKFNLYLDQTLFSQKLDHPLPLLKRFEQFILNDEDDCRMLVHTQNYPIFLEKPGRQYRRRTQPRQIRLSGLCPRPRQRPDRAVHLCMKSEIDLSLAQINEEINKMFLAGLRLYQ